MGLDTPLKRGKTENQQRGAEGSASLLGRAGPASQWGRASRPLSGVWRVSGHVGQMGGGSHGGPPDQRSPGLREARLQGERADLEVGRPGSWIPRYPSAPRKPERSSSCRILDTCGGRGAWSHPHLGAWHCVGSQGPSRCWALVCGCQPPRKTATPVSGSSLGWVSDALLSAPLVLAWGPPTQPHSLRIFHHQHLSEMTPQDAARRPAKVRLPQGPWITTGSGIHGDDSAASSPGDPGEE